MECVVKGVPVYYEVYGTGKPLIMLHGFSVDHRLMTGCMEPVFEQKVGWQRIYLDLPGMGKTPGMEHINSTDDMLDVVLAFIDAVIPGQRFLLVGESYGGYLARGVLARKFELVDGMALICPGIIMDRTKRELPEQTILVKDQTLLASLDPIDAENFDAISVVENQYTWERFRDEILPAIKSADERFLEKIEQHYSLTFDVDALPQSFTRPVLILVGRQDAVTGYRDAWRIIENYPRGTFAVLDRAGHNLQIEQPQIFTALMSEWLDRVEEATA